MAIGVNTWVWTSPFTDTQVELVGRAARMGCEVFEIAVEDPAHFDGQTVKNALDANGLRASICGAFGPSRDFTSDDPAPRAESLEYITATLRLAETWGVKVMCGPMYSAVGKHRHVSPEQRKVEWDLAVVGLREAGRRAADHGVTLAVEPLNRFETDLINTADQVVTLVDEIGLPNVKVHLDTFHMGIEEHDLYEAILLAGPRLAHVHACENDRGTPGTGLVNWNSVAKGLKEIGYTGDAVIESFTPECKAIAAAAAIWRPLAYSQDALAADGIVFLKSLLA